jgi:pimeloyl-ACP methyl ester carboxylesterase
MWRRYTKEEYRLWSDLAGRFFGAGADGDVVKAAKDLAFEQTTADLILATEVFHSRPDASDVVASWEKPLVVINGDQDGFVSIDKARRLAESAGTGDYTS